MKKSVNPYKLQPQKAFWIPSVADLHFSEISKLWQPFELKKTDKIATAGSCFAQHIGRNLHNRGASYMDLEPPPAFLNNLHDKNRFGYNIFSCRYGNIYTSRQLLQLFKESFGLRESAETVWEKKGRYFDAIRPGVNPVGHESPEEVKKLRKKHLEKVREMFLSVDVFVFTLGLTEAWEAIEDGTVYPLAPGTACGTYDENKYGLINLRYQHIYNDMIEFRECLKLNNPSARILLTVSPVPLMATATNNHVLIANSYSKSVLRAVAGDLAEDFEDVFYFPSYEIISTHPFKSVFYNKDQRSVNQFGVNIVMSHFFSGCIGEVFSSEESEIIQDDFDLICDEEDLDNERL